MSAAVEEAIPDVAHPAESHAHVAGWGGLALSLGALGVVYGDIGTSPLYTVQLIFAGDHPMRPSQLHVYGAISLIFWALILIVTLKYVLLILRADNQGEGGIMALVALIRRHVKTRTTAFVLVGILGASLFYGDGMLTPAISVVSAVSGLQVASPTLAAQIVPLSIGILLALFLVQRFGTGAVGGAFGPIMVVWFVTIGLLGLREVIAQPGIVKALSPTYGLEFVGSDPKLGFFALGSVFLAVTGAEAIYADMGHFGRTAVTRAWLFVVLPAVVFNYLGQGALVLAHPQDTANPFFLLVPGGQTGQKLMVILATAATVIASQAVISGAFSVTQQAMQLGFLPRLPIRHTSRKVMGQIYIPLVNWFLLIAVLILVLAFRSPTGLANAYGIALSAIFASNTFLAFVVFRKIWGKPLRFVIPGAAFFITIELTFFAANLPKVGSGGWLPLAVGAVFFLMLTTWRRGRMILADIARRDQVQVRRFINKLIDHPIERVAGTAVYMTSSLDVVPPALVTNTRANRVLHEQVVLVNVKTVGLPHVSDLGRIEIRWLRRGFVEVQVRYGYQDEPDLVAALEVARAQGLDIDTATCTFFIDHVSMLPTGSSPISPLRKRLFILLHKNATPAARYFGLPPERVFEVGAFVEI